MEIIQFEEQKEKRVKKSETEAKELVGYPWVDQHKHCEIPRKRNERGNDRENVWRNNGFTLAKFVEGYKYKHPRILTNFK